MRSVGPEGLTGFTEMLRLESTLNPSNCVRTMECRAEVRPIPSEGFIWDSCYMKFVEVHSLAHMLI